MHKYWENPAGRVISVPTRGTGGNAPFSVLERVKIGGTTIIPATVLAPMAGVTDTVFRRFIRNLGGCGLIMTEFTSADGVLRAKDKLARRYLHFYEDEHPISAQLFGSDPEIIAAAARMVEDLGFDMVDFNLGCPVKKVVKCNGGSGLLRDLPSIGRIFQAVRAAISIPFTVKFRAGWSEREIVCVELAKMAEDCGLCAVALHARTREQGYSGNARWEWIAAVKSAVKIPVIGNGDIRSPEDAVAMVDQTGCDAVMIGRSAASNPWIFRQIAQYISRTSPRPGVPPSGPDHRGHDWDPGQVPPSEDVGTLSYACAGQPASPSSLYDEPTLDDRFQMIRTYFQMLIEEEIPGAAGKMKQFASWFTHGVPGGAALRKAIYEAKAESEILSRVEEFFATVLELAPAGTTQAGAPSPVAASL